MVQEVGSFQSIEYVFQDGKVGYQDMDGVSFDIVYGYKTMFQYIYESMPERGNVRTDDAEQRKAISLTCGQFSYAEMVGKFDIILGVTGTLDCLNDFEKKILKRYKIDRLTFAPSVYGDSNLNELPLLV